MLPTYSQIHIQYAYNNSLKSLLLENSKCCANFSMPQKKQLTLKSRNKFSYNNHECFHETQKY